MNTEEANRDLLLQIEKNTLEAYRHKSDADFTKNFADDYIGVANDGIKNTFGEVSGMHKVEVQELSMADEKVTFPAKDVAVIVYAMVVKARLNGQEFSGKIYSSSVYVHREGNWLAVLHTESKS